MNLIILLVAIVFLSYILLLLCTFIKIYFKKSTINEAIREKRISDSNGKIYYVIPWPEADEKSWVERMKYLEKHSLEDDFAYVKEWSDYKDEHGEV